MAMAVAIAAVVFPFPQDWIESVYANGVFASMNRGFVPISNAVPVSVGDVEAIVALVVLIVAWVGSLSAVPHWQRGRTALRMAVHTLGWTAFLVIAFELLWGLNYHRATVSQRIVFDPTSVTDAMVAAFSQRIVDTLNRDVGPAHAERGLDRQKLAFAFLPVVGRLGDDWNVQLTEPKATLLQPYYDAAGIGGQYSPFSFETLLNTSFLPVEVPRALAHEWAHVAGFTDEGDANYIGTVACLRSDDPLIQYSGAFWTYDELPQAQRLRLKLDPRVIADFKASRARFARHYIPVIFSFQWHLYDGYLRGSGVRGGVASYGYFLRLLVGSQFDAEGLPLVKRMQRAS